MNKLTKLTLLRHGQSNFNLSCRQGAKQLKIQHQSWPEQQINSKYQNEFLFNRIQIDSPLTQNGIQQAKTMNEQLKMDKFDLVLTSPLERALQTTFEVFNGKNVKIIVREELAQACRFACDIVKEGDLFQKKKKYKAFDFGNVKNCRLNYTIDNEIIEKFYQTCDQKDIKREQDKQKLLMKLMMEKRFYESDEKLRERAWNVKKMLAQYHKQYTNICVVSHWYLLTYMISKKFSESSQNLEYESLENCTPYDTNIDQLLKVK